MELKIIDKYKNVDISSLKKMDLEELSRIYQGEDAGSQGCLISEVKSLFSKYKKLENSKLKEYILQYNDAIDCLLNFNHVFFIKYTHEKNEDKKKAAFSLIGSTQVHLTKLQSRYNQLVYRKQQREYKRSMIIARISLYVGIISLIVSVIISKWDK